MDNEFEQKTKLINEITEYIDSAKVKGVTSFDFEVCLGSKGISFPDALTISNFINKANNYKAFLERINETLNEYLDYVNNDIVIKASLKYEGLNKRLKFSRDAILKFGTVLSQDFSLNDLIINNTNKIFKKVPLEGTKELILEYVELLKKLLSKLSNLKSSNNIYDDSFKVFSLEFSNKKPTLEEFKKSEENIQNTLNKNYFIGFDSDGSEEVIEIVTVFWKAFNNLLLATTNTFDNSYLVNDNEMNESGLLDYLNDSVDKVYSLVNSIIHKPNFLCDKGLNDLSNLFGNLKRIRISRFINPVEKTDLKLIGEGEQKLDELIGLSTVKVDVQKIKAYIKANAGKTLNIHMCFKGNPGTGKTEVARIIAEILYENHVLPENKLIEVDRAGLVGQYIGQTASKTQEVIDKALGGVLFIDEAYSLIPEDTPSDYGHEALATLLKAMEDYRGKFCVIFAGYSNKMDKMISSNPGLKSRIQFEINFPNYSRDDLYDMTYLMLEKNEYQAEDIVVQKILDITDIKRKSPDFANARELRNTIDQVTMCQNLRTQGKDRILTLVDVDQYIKDEHFVLSSKDKNIVLTGEEELNELVGLDSIKKTVLKIKAYAKRNKGTNDLNLNMVFLGNPGTGKTEVARIISRILYENNVLPESKLIETDATGLISKYAGTTGSKTQEIINKAMGGVLFIDEAYSIGLSEYGSEAIAVLLKEMEDKRGKIAVILAGYKEEMNDLLSMNPGLESRIQFKLNFPDYTNSELKIIGFNFINKKGYTISEETMDKCIEIVSKERDSGNFANARCLRNLLEQIIMNQNLRTDGSNDNLITDKDVEEYIVEKGIN